MDMPYYELLARIHRELAPRTYVEVGVRHGESLALCRPETQKIGIDPAAAIRADLDPATTAIFNTTSDAFFAEHDVRALLGGRPVDLAFIDGMHLFEFALRDFINLEPLCDRDSVILIHDCLPIDAVTSARERTTAVWTGDVWKLVLVLKALRPDLHIVTSDVGPSGLGIVTHLDPGSTVLREHLDAICREYTGLGYEIVAADKRGALNVTADAWGDTRARRTPAAPAPAPAAPIDVADDAFCTLAFADEIAADPALLAAYAARFAGDDRATLLLRDATADPGVVGRLQAAVDAAGLDDATCPDLLLLSAGMPPDEDVAARAGAVLSARRPAPAFAGLAHFAQGQAGALAALARAGRGHARAAAPAVRKLGVVLTYNDVDIVGDVVGHLRANDHDVVVWDNGSTDGTLDRLHDLAGDLLELREVPKEEAGLYEIYGAMSRHLMAGLAGRYDWISWPDSDEILLGDDPAESYAAFVDRVAASPFDWCAFQNWNFWWTDEDDEEIESPVARVRHYALFPGCAPRLRAWRASCTNVREFNHNPPAGRRYPVEARLCHYPMRSSEQAREKLRTRAGIQRGDANWHYNRMLREAEIVRIEAQALNRAPQDPRAPGLALVDARPFDWLAIYGR
ncbi:MAG TPA: class I SAM-dependent methyltransferase [Solirubrobacteraceae bacterium]|nr:class I SAM-dependent methyltransferase [Solirubrobacteraceae bacterium]